jgi:hypothetical protein
MRESSPWIVESVLSVRAFPHQLQHTKQRMFDEDLEIFS